MRLRGRPGGRPVRLPAGMVGDTPRLVPAPMFLLAADETTLRPVRRLLDRHSQVLVDTRLRLPVLRVETTREYAVTAMHAAGLDAAALAHLTWDRAVDEELARSGRRAYVGALADNLADWKALSACWPAGAFVAVTSDPRAAPAEPRETAAQATAGERAVLTPRCRLEQARAALGAPVVHVEDVARDPLTASQRLVALLGVEWEPEMVEPAAAGEPTTGAAPDPSTGTAAMTPAGVAIPARPAGSAAGAAASAATAEALELARTWGYAEQPGPR